MKNADYRRILSFKDADNSSLTPSVGLWRLNFNQHLVALHGAIDLVGRNEDILAALGLPGIRPYKAKAIAMEVEAAGREVVARAQRFGDAPMLPVQLGELAAHGQAGKLLQKQAAFASAGEA